MNKQKVGHPYNNICCKVHGKTETGKSIGI